MAFEREDYLCKEPFLGGRYQYDCVEYSGGRAPSFQYPDLYCSGSQSRPTCSYLWYPDELEEFELVTVGARQHLCKRAWGGKFGDKDCVAYEGGDPNRLSFVNALKCSSAGGKLDCAKDYYPSEMEGLRLARIGYDDYLCEETYSGEECHYWYGIGSPKSAVMGAPDLYCNRSGVCADDGYPPSGW